VLRPPRATRFPYTTLFRSVRRIPMALREGEKPADSEGRIFGTQFGESPVPVGILVVEATGSAFVANTNADIVSVIDLSTWQVSGRLRAGREPDGLAWSPHVASRQAIGLGTKP